MLEIKELKKNYGSFTALSGISFHAQKGEILGLLGPNGAGKSTTMNIVTGYLPDFEGSVTLDGVEISEQPSAFRRKIGYLPEMTPLPEQMTVREYLSFSAELKSVPKKDRKEQVDRILASTGLAHMQNRLIRNLSKGYKQRTGIAQALIGDPELLILDEPTVGLDPKQLSEIRALVKSLAGDHIVIFSSHILSEVSAVCDRVVILYRGRLIAEGKPEELEQQFEQTAGTRVGILGDEKCARGILDNVATVSSYSVLQTTEDRTVCLVRSGDQDLPEKLFSACAAANVPLVELTPERLTLEDVFLHYVSEAEESVKSTSKTSKYDV